MLTPVYFGGKKSGGNIANKISQLGDKTALDSHRP
jgi:hypothetical protein